MKVHLDIHQKQSNFRIWWGSTTTVKSVSVKHTFCVTNTLSIKTLNNTTFSLKSYFVTQQNCRLLLSSVSFMVLFIVTLIVIYRVSLCWMLLWWVSL